MKDILYQLAATLKQGGNINIPTTSPDDILVNALNIVYFLAGVIAVIAIIFAGFTFVAAGSDPAAVTKARNTILYAIIGLVVIILAFFITNFITGRF